MHHDERHRVAVTGYGGICALGNSVDEIWQSILDYRLGYRHYTLTDKKIVSKFFGRIESTPDLRRFPKSIRKFLPEFAKLGLLSADEAITMAFQGASPSSHYSPFDCGVIFGTGWGGIDCITDLHASYAQTGISSPFSCMMGMHSVGTAAMSMVWNLRGYQNTPVAACSTSSIALGDAYEHIRNGRTKMMLAGGAESLNGNFSIWGADILQALSKEQSDPRKACCPFSLERSGFIMAEGAGIICLENMTTARARGATILAEITGYANFSDAYDMTAPAEDMAARAACITSACAQAGIAGSDIGYINAHGTSTPLNDLNETRSIKKALGPTAFRIPVSSTKSYTGHLMGAAGIMESIFCIKTLNTGLIPATANLNVADSACDLDFVPNVHRQGQTVTHALNLNYGFGGANSALVFSRADRE